MTTCGYFDDEAREYVITDPHTPVKWINYVGTLNFGGFVDHTGGSLICRRDPALNRITKYIPQLPAAEFKGETLYLRLRDETGQRLISPYFVPTLDPYDRFECHVGLGYSRFVCEIAGIRTEATVFVPLGGDRILRDILITNLRPAAVEVDAIPVVEYSHPDAWKQFSNADWVPQTMQSGAIHQDGGRVILLQYPFMYRDIRVNFLASNLPVSSWESDRRAFLGDSEYGTWARPLGLLREELSETEARRGDNIGALLHHLGVMSPGASLRLITQLGQVESIERALPSIETYRSPHAVEAAFRDLQRFWEDYLAGFQVACPDPATNRMLNIHNPRQCYVTKNWSRYLSLYQLGMGARGMGVRDSAQDLLGITVHAPQEAPALLRTLLRVQQPSGAAMHQFNPMTMVADAGDAREAEGAPPYYSDDHLWIVLAVAAYLKETGEIALLKERVPFCGAGGAGGGGGEATVLEHLRRAIEFTSGDLGAHGLPRLGFADWNDTVNLSAGAESVFTACLFAQALREMADLTEYLGDPPAAARYRSLLDQMRACVNEDAWDGDWYIAYFDADGHPLGSSQNAHGRIFLYPQAWAVISGIAPLERARRALDSVRRHLSTSRGIKLSAPGYDGFDPEVGGISTYPPGAKENGGIFLHTNPWAIIAETILGHGDRAFEIYSQINPASANERIHEYECEPYVYAQNILGDEHPQFGLARNSWLTGTAAWALQAGLQWILGLQPTYQGLRIAPCIPSAWDGFTARRRFRGARYELEVLNPGHVCTGVAALWLDDQPVAGQVLPPPGDRGTHRVRAVLGSGGEAAR